MRAHWAGNGRCLPLILPQEIISFLWRPAIGQVRYYPESLDRETWFEPLLVDDTFCPTEGLGVCVMACDEALDVIDELRDAGERASFQRFGRQDREPDLDLIQP